MGSSPVEAWVLQAKLYSLIIVFQLYWLCVSFFHDCAVLSYQLEMAYRRQEEALLTADAYRVAFEQQLTKNSTLIYELLEKSSWRKKFGFCGPTKKMAMKESDAMCEEKDLFDQIKTHKDDIVKKLVGMVCVTNFNVFFL